VYKPVVAFAILIVAWMVRPQGLFRTREGRVNVLASGSFWRSSELLPHLHDPRARSHCSSASQAC